MIRENQILSEIALGPVCPRALLVKLNTMDHDTEKNALYAIMLRRLEGLNLESRFQAFEGGTCHGILEEIGFHSWTDRSHLISLLIDKGIIIAGILLSIFIFLCSLLADGKLAVNVGSVPPSSSSSSSPFGSSSSASGSGSGSLSAQSPNSMYFPIVLFYYSYFI